MSIQATLVNLMLRFSVKPSLMKKLDVEAFRKVLNDSIRLQAPLPEDVQIDSLSLGGVLTERLSAQTARTAAAILYIHGGAWSSGSPQSHRPITSRLANQTGVAVYAIDYRLSPHHPYPA